MGCSSGSAGGRGRWTEPILSELWIHHGRLSSHASQQWHVIICGTKALVIISWSAEARLTLFDNHLRYLLPSPEELLGCSCPSSQRPAERSLVCTPPPRLGVWLYLELQFLW